MNSVVVKIICDFEIKSADDQHDFIIKHNRFDSGLISQLVSGARVSFGKYVITIKDTPPRLYFGAANESPHILKQASIAHSPTKSEAIKEAMTKSGWLVQT